MFQKYNLFIPLYKFINWYTRRFRFPKRGLKACITLLRIFGLYHRDFIKKLHNGLLMYVRPSEHIQQQLFWYGYYEKEAALTWEQLLHQQMIVLDIGANTGYYTLLASPRAKQVFSFEPSALSRKWLERNINLNCCANVRIEAAAAGDMKTTATFYHASADNSGMSGMAQPENYSGQSELIPVVRIDDWLDAQSLQQVDMIKIDVEGAEMKVLTGMKNTLQKYEPAVFIEAIDELLNKFGNSHTDIFKFFEEAGYKCYDIPGVAVLKKREQPMESYSLLFLPGSYILPGTVRIE